MLGGNFPDVAIEDDEDVVFSGSIVDPRTMIFIAAGFHEQCRIFLWSEIESVA